MIRFFLDFNTYLGFILGAVGVVGYLYFNGSTLIWKKKK